MKLDNSEGNTQSKEYSYACIHKDLKMAVIKCIPIMHLFDPEVNQFEKVIQVLELQISIRASIMSSLKNV
jgi:hypothetical protein